MRLTYEETQKIIRSKEWKNFRKQWIAKNKPTNCEACGVPIEGGSISLDHSIPLTQGGYDVAFREDLIVAMCVSCNSRKQDKQLLRNNYYNKKLLDL